MRRVKEKKEREKTKERSAMRGGRRKEKTLLALIASTGRIEDDLLSLRSSRLPLCIARDRPRRFARRLSFNIPTQKNVGKRKCHTFSFGRCLSRPRLSAQRMRLVDLPQAILPRSDGSATVRRCCTGRKWARLHDRACQCSPMLRNKIQRDWKYMKLLKI